MEAKVTFSDHAADFFIWLAELPILGEYILCSLVGIYGLLHGTDMDA